MAPQTLRRGFVIILGVAVLILPACGSSSPTTPTTSTTTPTTPVTLFEDAFVRADSDSLGAAWNEYTMRNGVVTSANSPWKIQSGELRYEATGVGTYTEDFIETVATFTPNNITVTFDLRAQVATTLGYVGPTMFLSGTATSRGSAQNVASGPPHIGFSTWYRWENRGTAGLMVVSNGTSYDSATATVAGVNQSAFATHTITIKNNTLTYADSGFTVSYPIAGSLATDARHLSFGARLYDTGVSQVIEIKNVKITQTS